MRRWLLPLLAGLVAALAAYQTALIQTPRVLMRAAIGRVGQTGMNRMFHGPLPTDKSRAVVRPSPDLAYSSCPFDLSSGPVRIHVPPIPSAYWSLSVFDARTDVAYVHNNRETHGGGIDLVLVQGKWTYDPPSGERPDAIRVEGERGIALVRVLVEDRAAFAPIDAARRGATCGVVR